MVEICIDLELHLPAVATSAIRGFHDGSAAGHERPSALAGRISLRAQGGAVSTGPLQRIVSSTLTLQPPNHMKSLRDQDGHAAENEHDGSDEAHQRHTQERFHTSGFQSKRQASSPRVDSSGRPFGIQQTAASPHIPQQTQT
jgi:hypothetical protein